MPVLTIEYRDERERLGLEQAIAFFTQMRQVAQTAPDRHGAGRLRAGHGSATDRRCCVPASPPPCRDASRRPNKGGRPRRGLRVRPRRPLQGAARASRLTAVGPIDVGRRYFTCPACGQGDFGADP